MADQERSQHGWVCAACGGGTSDEDSLRDHQAWCLGDPAANMRLLADAAEQGGMLDQAALVALARTRRPPPAPGPPPPPGQAPEAPNQPAGHG